METGPQTLTGAVVGTAPYMSPEQVRGFADERSDLFSVGVILWEMITGVRPFGAATTVETGLAILNEEPRDPEKAFPPSLERIARRCLEKDPARRFQTASELASALRESAAAPSRRRNRWRAVAAALLVLAAAGWFLRRESRLRWARKEALPAIARLIEQNRYPEAFALARRAEAVIPGDPLLTQLDVTMKETLDWLDAHLGRAR